MNPRPQHRPPRDYTRLERHRPLVLCPRTWDMLLGDATPLGTAGPQPEDFIHAQD